MSQKELLAYIKPNLEKGFKAEQLKAELVKVGWEEAAVDEAFLSLSKPANEPSPQLAEAQNKEVLKTETTEKEDRAELKPNSELELGSVQALNRAAIKEDMSEGVEKNIVEEKKVEVNKSKDLGGEPSKKEGLKKIKIQFSPKLRLILIIFLSLIVLGVLAFFAYARFQDSPMKVLDKSLLAMESIYSFDYSLEVKGEYQWKSGDFSDLISDPFAILDASEYEGQALSSSLQKHQASLSLSGYSSTKTSDLGSRFNLSFISDEMREGEKINIETRFVQDQAFLKLSLPKLDNIDLSSIEGKWLKTSLPQEGDSVFSSLSPKENSELVVTKDGAPSNNASKEELLEEMAKLKELVIRYQPFKVTDTYASSLTDGQKTYHYILEFDKLALEQLLLEMQSKKAEELKEFMANLDLISGELVIGRDDFLMHQFKLNLSMKDGAYSDDQLQILNLNFNLSLYSFNKEMEIDKPQNSIELEVAFEELFSTFMPELSDSELDMGDMEENYLIGDDLIDLTDESALVEDMELDSDSDGLSDYEEINIYGTDPLNPDSDGDGLTDFEEIMIYGTDPLNPDSDGDGYSDGEEVLNGYNPLGEGLLEDAYKN